MYWYRIYYRYNEITHIFTQLAHGGADLFKQIDLIVNIFKADVLKVECAKSIIELNDKFTDDIEGVI